jgi:ATP-binding cassette subfamily B protein
VTYYRRVLPYLRPYWRLVIVSIAMVGVGSLAALLTPWPLKILVDSVLGTRPAPGPLAAIGHNRTHLLIFAVLAGLGVTLLLNGLTVLDEYVNTKIDQGMVLDFRSDLFQHALRLSFAYHDERRYGELIYIINYMADAAAKLVIVIPPLAQSVLTLIGMFYISFRIDRELALLSLSVMPFLYYSVNYYVKHIQERLYEVKNMEHFTISIIHEAITMHRVIAAFCREPREFRRFREQGERAVKARVGLTVRQTAFSLGVNTITAAGTALVLGFGAYHVLHGGLTVGDLLIVMSYVAAMYKPLETISNTAGSLQDQFIALKMAFDLFDTVPEIADAPDAAPMEHARGEISFEDVHFSYANRKETLKAITFTAHAGQRIAIVGPTGAGKTTLISMIPRFYDPSHGRILLDGVDIRRVTLKSLRERISIVLQEPLLFTASIAENIRYGRPDATMEQVIEAARAANAHDFIARLPNGYDTELGERGALLSGGERQRIAVARAFIKDAPILILDEPTSSIDSRTESVILEALDRLMVGRTTFIVAHRLSTVRDADRILVLNQGEIVEQGTQDELLERNDLYRQLYEMQQRRPPAAEPRRSPSRDVARIPAVVFKVAPVEGETDASPSTDVVAVFSRAMDAATLTTDTMVLIPHGSATAVTGTVVYDEECRAVTFRPTIPLEPGRGYTAAIIAGRSGAKDSDGTPLVVDAVWNFAVNIPALAAQYRCDPPAIWHPGETHSYDVTVTNTGTQVWNASSTREDPHVVRLGTHFMEENGSPEYDWKTDERFPLAHDVPAGESATIRVAVTAPMAEGPWILRHRMVKENVAWFSQVHETRIIDASRRDKGAEASPPGRALPRLLRTGPECAIDALLSEIDGEVMAEIRGGDVVADALVAYARELNALAEEHGVTRARLPLRRFTDLTGELASADEDDRAALLGQVDDVILQIREAFLNEADPNDEFVTVGDTTREHGPP